MTKAAIRHVITALSTVRLVPHILLMLACANRTLIWADLDRFAFASEFASVSNFRERVNFIGRILQFITCMTWKPEFRNVFYFRTGMPGLVLSMLCRPMSSLELDWNMKVGPGFVIMHGNGTFVLANEIGDNCTIYQQVTIGKIEGYVPTIGNNVQIFAGAKVLGKIRVGDNVTIAANSLVIKDVPANVGVMGVPATIFWRKATSNEERRE